MNNEKVAIYCPTKQDWLKMLETIKPFAIIAEQYPSSDCINKENTLWLHCDRLWYENAGYKIISLEDYLKSNSEYVISSDVNPKAQIGSYALPMGMISPLFAAHVALGKLNGAEKYGLSNYIGTEVVMSIYLDAIQRHLDKIKMGEVVDEVDGVNHFGAIGANCDIILSAQAAGTLIDDRPLCTGQLEAYKALTPMVKQLKELHKEKNPKHYYAKDFK